MSQRVSLLDSLALGRHKTYSLAQTNWTAAALRERARTVVVVLAAFGIAFFAQALLVKQFGVNLPFWDEWSAYPQMLLDYRSGTLTWQSLFDQHNEHRIFDEKLVTLGTFALLGEWSPIANMLVSAFVVGCTAAIWAYTLRRLALPAWVGLLSALILVSPIQFANITWGFQTLFYMLGLSTLIGVSVVALSRRVSWLVVLVAIIACFWGTFSILSGLFTWGVVGACLLLRVLLAAPTFRSALNDRGLWAKAGLFCAAAVAHIVFYFLYRYAWIMTPGGQAQSIGSLLHWTTMALGYPFSMKIDQPLVLMIGAALLQWVPIALLVALLVRRRRETLAQQRLVLIVGLALFVVGNALLVSYGRAGIIAVVASRYVTIFQWSSLLCLFAIAALLGIAGRLSARSQRLALVGLSCLICASLLLAHEQRAAQGLGNISDNHRLLGRMRQTVISYLNDPAPARKLGDPMPFAPLLKSELKQQLDTPAIVALLPGDLRPAPEPKAWSKFGTAWLRNGVTAQTLPASQPFAWGSWHGDARQIGRIESPPIRCTEAIMRIAVAGYPDVQRGNMLAIEPIDAPQQRIVYDKGDVGERWGEWLVDISSFRGKDVRIVAIDGSTQANGWLGFGWPTQMSRPTSLLNRLLDQLEYLAVIVGTALGVSCLALWPYQHAGDRQCD